MTPTYINILNVYAFCNTHDITWGTKGDDKAEKLPSVTTKPGGKVDFDAPSDDADLNTAYEKEIMLFSTKYVEPKKVPTAQDKQEDYYKGFRSGVVLAWMFCNLALCAVVLQTAGLEVTVEEGERDIERNRKAKIYMMIVLWSVAGLSAFRFVGAVWFLIVRMVSLACSFLSLPTSLPRWSSSTRCCEVVTNVFDSSVVFEESSRGRFHGILFGAWNPWWLATEFPALEASTSARANCSRACVCKPAGCSDRCF